MTYCVLILFFLLSPLRAADIPNRELGKKALKTIVQEINNPDSDIRSLSCEILGEIGNKSASKLLNSKLSDISKYVRISAAKSLYRLGQRSAMGTILGIIKDIPGKKPILNNPLLEMKVISKNKMREYAIEAYTELRGRKAVELLYALKRDDYGIIRDAAARQLARLGEKDELLKFIYALSDEDEGIRFEAASSLSKICSENAVEPLAKQLKLETSVRVKIAILDALACSGGGSKAVMRLLKITQSKNPTLRFKAVKALSMIRKKELKEKFTAIYEENNDLGTKLAAMKGLMNFGKKPDIFLLKSALGSKEEEIKELALEIIRKIPMSEAKPLLSRAIDDGDYRIRLYAAKQILKRLAKK